MRSLPQILCKISTRLQVNSTIYGSLLWRSPATHIMSIRLSNIHFPLLSLFSHGILVHKTLFSLILYNRRAVPNLLKSSYPPFSVLKSGPRPAARRFSVLAPDPEYGLIPGRLLSTTIAQKRFIFGGAVGWTICSGFESTGGWLDRGATLLLLNRLLSRHNPRQPSTSPPLIRNIPSAG